MKVFDGLDRIYRPIRLDKLLGRFNRLHLLGRTARHSPKKPSRLRIAFFTDTYLPNVDGVVNSIVSYRSELARRGHEAFVLAPGTLQDKQNNADKGVYFFPSVRFPPYPQYKVPVFPFLSARKIVRQRRAHLVHSHAMTSMGVAAVVTAKDLRLPLVGTFHTLIPKAGKFVSDNSLWDAIYTGAAWAALKQFYRPFDLVTVPTKSIEKLLNENGIENTVIVPNGIDVDRFSPRLDGSAVRKALNIPPEAKVVLSSGRISYEKNLDVVLKAARRVLAEEQAVFVIQGEGPARKKLEQLAARLGVSSSVIFTGFVKDFEVPLFLAASDVFVTASTFETQGLALLEAMAFGKACVGANSMAIPELVSDGRNGFLFQPYSDVDCARAIVEALRLPPKKRKAMGASAVRTASHYSIQESTAKLLKAYDKVL